MSTPTSSAQPPPHSRPRTINDLPIEIKKYIVELAAKQDAVYDKWTRALQPRLRSVAGAYLAEQTNRHGKSIAALFQTSRTWSQLAAPFRFKVLKASRANVKYAVYVARRRAHYFTALHLDTDNSSRLISAFSSLSSANRIVELHVHETISKRMHLADFDDEMGLRDLMSETLERLLEDSVVTLHFHNLPARSAANYLPYDATTAVRHLVVHVDHQTQALSPAVGRSINEAALESLSIIFSAPSPDPSVVNLFDHLTAAFTSPGATHFLRSLSLEDSLGTLNLTQTNDNEDLGHFDTTVFPRLSSLRLAGDWIGDVLSSVKPAGVPALRHLEYQPNEGFSEVDATLERVLVAFGRQLVSVRAHEGITLFPWESAELRRMCDDLPHSVVAFDTPDLPIVPSWPVFAFLEELSPDATIACRPFVESLPSFLVEEVERARGNDDEASFVGLAAALQTLELERTARSG